MKIEEVMNMNVTIIIRNDIWEICKDYCLLNIKKRIIVEKKNWLQIPMQYMWYKKETNCVITRYMMKIFMDKKVAKQVKEPIQKNRWPKKEEIRSDC